MLFPILGRELPEIARISYLTPRGSMRTYPRLDPSDLQPGWTAQGEAGYQVGARTPSLAVKWTSVHPGMVGAQRVISAVAPVHQSKLLKGVVVIDISLEKLTTSLKHLTVTQTGFAFLINYDGRLVAAPEQGQMQLIGHVMSPGDVGVAAIDIPSLAPGLAAMRSNSSGVASVDVRGRPFVLAYAGILPLKWSLGLLAPVEEITASTATTTTELSSIAGQTQMFGLLMSLAALALLVLVLTYWLSRWLIRPLASLTTATASVAAGDLRHIEVAGGDEIGQLAASFNQMTGAVQEREAALQNLAVSLEQRVADRTAELEQSIAELRETTSARDQLSASIRNLSSPVVPVLDGILVMPLVGVIDTERATLLLSTLLSATERHRASLVIVDVTGVPIVDTQVARVLLKAASAIRLLGAQTVLVGLRPELAQTIVGLGLDLTSLVTRADLQSAVSYALQQRQHRRSVGTVTGWSARWR
jgi:anti-anti-sigma regulatory factor/HAMP domain-containing protein